MVSIYISALGYVRISDVVNYMLEAAEQQCGQKFGCQIFSLII
jgi:hypothetical protein